MMIIIKNNIKFSLGEYASEDEFEQDVKNNAKNFFGTKIIYIDIKRKIESKELGGSIPDGFLFDLSDIENPNFYLVEIELAIHDFYKHIFPQITKFFAFFKSSKNRSKLVEKIFTIINSDSSLKKEFKKYLGEKEIYKFLKDVIDDSQNILLIIDGEKNELPEIIETYTDTWGKMVKILIIRKFQSKDENLYVLDPEFEIIEYAQEETIDEQEQTDFFTEEMHLEGVSDEIKNAYFSIKNNLLKHFPHLRINPQKYYLSFISKKNIAFFKFRKKKIRLLVMIPEDDLKKKIKFHKVKSLSDSVQNFYRKPCAEVVIETDKNLQEVINLLKGIISEEQNFEND